MKILFIENRSATWLWESIAKILLSDGHEIYWIVYNKSFTPRIGNCLILKKPTKKDLKLSFNGAEFSEIANTDRNYRYYGGSQEHYSFYNDQIRDLFQKIKPGIVFGEATQFYELLAIKNAKILNTLYLSPCAARYPPGRMCFYAFDTLECFGGSGFVPPNERINELILNVGSRKVVPTYMIKANSFRLLPIFLKLYSHSLLLLSWISGDYFTTPSPWKRISLSLKKRIKRRMWESKSCFSLPPYLNDSNWVLYPMQMQPESNIDVWGQPWNDQVDIIFRASRELRKIGAFLVVKPNPKSKYEIIFDQANMLEKCPNVIFLSHGLSMGSIFNKAPVILTVTGTVILEAIFVKKIIASLGKHALKNYPGVTPIAAPEDIADVLQNKCKIELDLKAENAVTVVKSLYRTSYDANIWDPILKPEMMNRGELKSLYNAFKDVIGLASKI